MIKLAAFWAFIIAHVVPLAILVGVALFAFQSCKGNKDSESAIVMKERIRVSDSVIAAKDSALATTQQQLGMALANGTRIVDRWHESAPRPITAGSAHDTITQQAKQIRECREAGDSLVASVVVIRSACTAFRDTATKVIANLRLGLAQRDSLIKIGKPPRRFGLGVFLGYGVHNDSSFAFRRGMVAGVGLSYSVIQF